MGFIQVDTDTGADQTEQNIQSLYSDGGALWVRVETTAPTEQNTSCNEQKVDQCRVKWGFKLSVEKQITDQLFFSL